MRCASIVDARYLLHLRNGMSVVDWQHKIHRWWFMKGLHSFVSTGW